MISPTSNQFAPPSSATDSDRPSTVRPGFLWRPYFWLFSAGLVYWTYLTLSGQASVPLVGYVWLPLQALGALGMWGYIYRRRLLGPRFWRIWLPFQVLGDLSVVTLVTDWAAITAGDTTAVMYWILGWIWSFPFYLALYRYTRHSHQLWHPAIRSPSSA